MVIKLKESNNEYFAKKLGITEDELNLVHRYCYDWDGNPEVGFNWYDKEDDENYWVSNIFYVDTVHPRNYITLDIGQAISRYGFENVKNFCKDALDYMKNNSYYRNKYLNKSITDNKKFINKKFKKLTESDNNYYTFNELNSLQQNYVVDNWSEINKLSDEVWDAFNESMWIDWDFEKRYIADEFCTIPMKGNESERWKGDTELGINVDKCYWNESSQGPYPEWKLDKVFDTFYGKTSSSVNEEVEFEIHFANMAAIDVKRAVDIDIWCKDDNGEYTWEYGVDAYNVDVYLNDDNDPYNARGYIKAVINQAQKFIDKFWNEIEYRCSATPDDDWVRDFLETDDYLTFNVSDKGIVYVGYDEGRV